MNVTLILPETPRIHFKMGADELGLLQAHMTSARSNRAVTMFGARIVLTEIELEFSAPSGPSIGDRKLFGEATIRAFYSGVGEREKLKFG